MNKRISSFEKEKKLNYYLNVNSLNNNLPIRRESVNSNSKFTLKNDKQINYILFIIQISLCYKLLLFSFISLILNI